VYYKFKSQREESKVSFDGTGISVFDLKKEIVLANNLKANDFDLLLYDPSTDQEYKDDSYVIPRSSSVIAKRIPAARAGKGKGAMYVAAAAAGAASSLDGGAAKDKQTAAPVRSRMGLGSMSKRFDGKEDAVKPRATTPTVASSVAKGDEAAAMAAMFKAQTENWEETQEKMSQSVLSSGSSVICVVDHYLISFSCPCVCSGLCQFTVTREALVAVENLSFLVKLISSTSISLTDHFLRAMSAIVAAKKDIGSMIARLTMIVSLTIDRASSARPVFRAAF